MISLDFELAIDPDPKQTYTAIIGEVKHGEFVLEAVQYKPKDKLIGPAKHDIVLPGRYAKCAIAIPGIIILSVFSSMQCRKYDIRIAHKSGPSILSTTESLSYKAAEAITKSMERKRY